MREPECARTHAPPTPPSPSSHRGHAVQAPTAGRHHPQLGAGGEGRQLCVVGDAGTGAQVDQVKVLWSGEGGRDVVRRSACWRGRGGVRGRGGGGRGAVSRSTARESGATRRSAPPLSTLTSSPTPNEVATAALVAASVRGRVPRAASSGAPPAADARRTTSMRVGICGGRGSLSECGSVSWGGRSLCARRGRESVCGARGGERKERESDRERRSLSSNTPLVSATPAVTAGVVRFVDFFLVANAVV